MKKGVGPLGEGLGGQRKSYMDVGARSYKNKICGSGLSGPVVTRGVLKGRTENLLSKLGKIDWSCERCELPTQKGLIVGQICTSPSEKRSFCKAVLSKNGKLMGSREIGIHALRASNSVRGVTLESKKAGSTIPCISQEKLNLSNEKDWCEEPVNGSGTDAVVGGAMEK